MGMPRKTVAQLKAEGSRHYSKDQLEEREASEVKVPPADPMKVPKFLTGKLATKYTTIATVLAEAGILSSLDGDGLARYLIAENNYLKATKRLDDAMKDDGDKAGAAIDRWASIQDKFFKQCRSAAADLGLTVTSRGQLRIPSRAPEVAQDEGESELFGD